MPMQIRGECVKCGGENKLLDEVSRVCDDCRTNSRGFREYLRLYPEKGAKITLDESSLACEGAHCWLRLMIKNTEGVSALLSVPEVKALLRALHEFVDEAEDGLLIEPATIE